MEKWKKCTLTLASIILSASLIGCAKQKTISIDPFEDIQIKEKGWNHSGYLDVEKGDISYNGNDQTVQKLIDSIDFKIKPNKSLENGDQVTIELQYDKDLFQRVSVQFTKESKKYTLSKLTDKKQTIRTEEKEIIDENGNKKTDINEYILIDGVEIPASWNMTEEEMQDYVQYVKEQDNETGFIEEHGVQEDWIQGTAKEETHRKNAKFYMRDYGNLDMDCYQEAYEFGNTSSQKFKIRPIIEKDRTIGYECQFKEETK